MGGLSLVLIGLLMAHEYKGGSWGFAFTTIVFLVVGVACAFKGW